MPVVNRKRVTMFDPHLAASKLEDEKIKKDLNQLYGLDAAKSTPFKNVYDVKDAYPDMICHHINIDRLYYPKSYLFGIFIHWKKTNLYLCQDCKTACRPHPIV